MALTFPHVHKAKNWFFPSLLFLASYTYSIPSQACFKFTSGFASGTLMGTLCPPLATVGAFLFSLPLIHVFTKNHTNRKTVLTKVAQLNLRDKFINTSLQAGYGALYGLCLGGFLFPAAEHTDIAKIVAWTSLATVTCINCTVVFIAIGTTIGLALLLNHAIEVMSRKRPRTICQIIPRFSPTELMTGHMKMENEEKNNGINTSVR